MNLFKDASLIITPNGVKAGKLYALKGDDLNVVRATSATYVGSDGLIRTALANEVRFDYSNGTCPSILVELQRTNLFKNSEDFSNSSFYKVNTTITTNSIVSPDGNITADLCSYTSSTNVLSTQVINSNNSDYTISIFAKKGTGNILRIRETFYFGIGTVFNLDLGTVVSGTGKIENYGNGWYRCSITKSYLNTQTIIEWSFDSNENINNLYLWGAQLEAGSCATSYIPTTSASVTRDADLISKTGISSLIGQTEGTIFVEEVYDANVTNNGGLDDALVCLTDGTSNNLISIFHYGTFTGGLSTKVLFWIRLNNNTQAFIQSNSLNSGTYKIALAYKNNDVVAYINGVQIGTDTSASIPSTSAITLVDPVTTNAATKTVNIKSAVLFKTRLSNNELATLTTI